MIAPVQIFSSIRMHSVKQAKPVHRTMNSAFLQRKRLEEIIREYRLDPERDKAKIAAILTLVSWNRDLANKRINAQAVHTPKTEDDHRLSRDITEADTTLTRMNLAAFNLEQSVEEHNETEVFETLYGEGHEIQASLPDAEMCDPESLPPVTGDRPLAQLTDNEVMQVLLARFFEREGDETMLPAELSYPEYDGLELLGEALFDAHARGY